MLKAQNIKCKVYLEGIQVKFNRIEIREQVGAPAQCTIGFPANDKAIFAYPKTAVHVFYKHTDGEYYLIFEGQLIGYGIQRNFDRREVQFTFAGLLYNWSNTAAANQDLTLMSYVGNFALSVGGASEKNLALANARFNTSAWLDALVKKLELQKQTVIRASEEYEKKKTLEKETVDKLQKNLEKEKEDFDKIKKDILDTLSEDIKKTETELNADTTNKDQKEFLKIGIAGITKRKGEIEKMDCSTAPDLKNIGGITGPNIFGASFLTKVAAVLSKGKYSLDTVISLILQQSGNSLSTYYNSVNTAFKLEKRLRVISSNDIEQLLSNTAVYSFLSAAVGQEENGSSPKSLLQIFEGLLSTIAYNIFEVAAPSWAKHPTNDSESPTSLFMSPPGDYLSPLSCNFIFNDDIQSLSFSRNIDEEPTRAMSFAKPFATSGFNNDGGLGKVLLATIVPQGRVGGQAGKITISQTKEELLRGINLAYRDETLMSSLYMINYLNSHGGSAAIKNGELKFSAPANPDPPAKVASAMESDKVIRPYHTNIANAEFYLQRGASRNMTVLTTYSPYRVCGFTGVIFDEQLPYIMGKINSIFTSISADGQATQTLNFTNVRFHAKTETNSAEVLLEESSEPKDLHSSGGEILPGDISSGASITGDLNTGTATDMQDVIDFIPYWYAAFNKYLVHKNFYQYLTGEKNRKDLIGIAKEEGLEDSKLNKLFNCLEYINAKYSKLSGKTKNDFIEKITSRNLVKEQQYWTFVQGTAGESKKFPNLTLLTEPDNKYGTGKMFYKNKQDRIKLYFETFVIDDPANK